MKLENELIEFLSWYAKQNGMEVDKYFAKDWLSDYKEMHTEKNFLLNVTRIFSEEDMKKAYEAGQKRGQYEVSGQDVEKECLLFSDWLSQKYT